MELSTTAFSLPLSEPLETARGAIAERRGLLVRVRDAATASSDGAASDVGVGEATPLPGWTESFDACRDALDDAAPVLARRGPEAALAALSEAPAARHGLELAIADLRARRDGRPLYGYLRDRIAARSRAGGADADSYSCDDRSLDDRSRRDDAVSEVPINATIGDGEPDVVAERASTVASSGVRCCKLKVGARSTAADEERVRAVREAVGEDVALRLDANGAWDASTARDAIDRLGAYDLEYVEQPLPADALAEHAALRDNVALALDESLATHELEDVLAADAADVLVCKPTVLGGPIRTVALADRARAAGLDVVVSTAITGVVARSAAVHVAAALAPIRPCGLATASLLDGNLAPDPAPVEGGSVRVPQDPGTGVSLAALAERVD